MKIAVEFRSFMSIAETFRAMTICQEAVARLAHRMSDADLDRVDRFAMTLSDIAQAERERRRDTIGASCTDTTARLIVSPAME